MQTAPEVRERDDHPQLGLIWAQAHGGVIGADGTMPWHLREDLRHFRDTTLGSPVVMGRRTWESFPTRFRPLPGRTNIVITRDDRYALDGALRAHNLDDALGLAARAGAGDESADATIWVIGGGGVFGEVIDRADLLVVTEIDLEAAGDTFAPDIPEDFEITATIPARTAEAPDAPLWCTGASGLRYRIVTYRRR